MKTPVISTTWFTNRQGGRAVASLDPEVLAAKGYVEKCTLRSNVLIEEVTYADSNLGMQRSHEWNAELVTAMVSSGAYDVENAILLAGMACKRCERAFAYEFGLRWGYARYSFMWEDFKGRYCTLCDERVGAFGGVYTESGWRWKDLKKPSLFWLWKQRRRSRR